MVSAAMFPRFWAGITAWIRKVLAPKWTLLRRAKLSAVGKTVYFDANVFFDVFELRDPTFHPKLTQLVAQKKAQIVVSDLTLVEALEGNHRQAFAPGVTRLLALSPSWIYLAGLTGREVERENGQT